MLDETRTTCAYRRTDGKFVLPIGRPGQHKIRQIGAGDQQHQHHNAHQQKRGAFDVPRQFVLTAVRTGIAGRVYLPWRAGYRATDTGRIILAL